MTTKITATVSRVQAHRFDAEHALVDIALASMDAEQSTQTYQLPLPAQTLADGSQIDASPPFAVPGEPDVAELRAGCMVLARYWLAQLGLPSSESDVELTVEGGA